MYLLEGLSSWIVIFHKYHVCHANPPTENLTCRISTNLLHFSCPKLNCKQIPSAVPSYLTRKLVFRSPLFGTDIFCCPYILLEYLHFVFTMKSSSLYKILLKSVLIFFATWQIKREMETVFVWLYQEKR